MEYILTFAHTSQGETFLVDRRPTGNEKSFAFAHFGEDRCIERRAVFATKALFPAHE